MLTDVGDRRRALDALSVTIISDFFFLVHGLRPKEDDAKKMGQRDRGKIEGK